MINHGKEESDALKIISSTISNCEKAQLKFAAGTSQHSLLKNRIKALYISQAVISNDGSIKTYTGEELSKALPPVISIISKTEKAQSKYEKESAQYRRFEPIIKAMRISESLIKEELCKREL
ncbi:MAG: hypothetical protein QM657_00070 [Lacrimispora sp.]|uniref:hypothetical protein n=1 Tax=Lacrimispora sp. TaxID=2719234 RepID=UPI0039E600A4